MCAWLFTDSLTGKCIHWTDSLIPIPKRLEIVYHSLVCHRLPRGEWRDHGFFSAARIEHKRRARNATLRGYSLNTHKIQYNLKSEISVSFKFNFNWFHWTRARTDTHIHKHIRTRTLKKVTRACVDNCFELVSQLYNLNVVYVIGRQHALQFIKLFKWTASLIKSLKSVSGV